MEKKRSQIYTRTVWKNFWGESPFSKGKFFNLWLYFLRLTIFRVKKSKNYGRPVKAAFYMSWGSFWGELVFLRKKFFLSSIVEPKNVQSSNRKFKIEILKQKFSHPQEGFQEECFASKNLWLGMFSWDMTKKFQKGGWKTLDINKFVKTAFYMSGGTFWSKKSWFLGKKTISRLYSDCLEEILRWKFFPNGYFLNRWLRFLRLTFCKVTKSKNYAELSKLHSTCP